MGRHAEAAVILHDAGQTVAGDPTIQGWSELAAAPAPPVAPAPPGHYSEFEPSASELGVDPSATPAASVAPEYDPTDYESPLEALEAVSSVPDFEPAAAEPPSADSPVAAQLSADSPSADSPVAAQLSADSPAATQLGAHPSSVAAPSAYVDQQLVIDDLFNAERMSWEIVEYFEKTYQNVSVDWTGEVVSFHTFRHDLDFGDGPGVKATILLGTVGRSEFISNEVHAMVQLPEGFEPARGAEVRFRGVLTHVDRFARKVYVAYGELQ